MKKVLLILMLTTLLFAVSAIAADKVVVIPLCGEKVVTVSNFSGAWSPNTTYQAGQTVQIDGSTNVSLVTHTSEATLNMANWSLMAAKGVKGAKGDKGDNGDKGDKGDSGSDGISCWDTNSNGTCDLASEDIDNSLACDTNDCKGEQGIPGSSSFSVSVFDANNTNIGYFLGGSHVQNATGGAVRIVSSKGYFAEIYATDSVVRYGSYDDSLFFGAEVVFTDPSCTGSYYLSAEASFGALMGVFSGARPGQVSKTSWMTGVYYVPLDTVPVTLPVPISYRYPGCTEIANQLVYELVPNNPDVTGFQNSYTAPLKGTFNLP